jgi:N-glycosylase/DNA lyase
MPSVILPVSNYNLDSTLDSGQAFRWVKVGNSWEGVVGTRWVRLSYSPDAPGIRAETCQDPDDWSWLKKYLDPDFDLDLALSTFPQDPVLQEAIQNCSGLRLLRQDPWECLASFILSSTKQIVQIREVISNVTRCFGAPIKHPGSRPLCSFPSPQIIASVSETELRSCKMGFRAPYFKAAAELVHSGQIDLPNLHRLPLGMAREQLMKIPGVGRKIADCALLFSCGFEEVFPVDVWIRKVLQQLYFKNRKIKAQRLIEFAETHFGPYGGLAQQYLFHYFRTAGRNQVNRRPIRSKTPRSKQNEDKKVRKK